MKKLAIMLFGLLLVSGIYAESNSMSFVLNIGTTTDSKFRFKPFWWTIGGELDLPVGSALTFSPEATLVGSFSDFENFFFWPAAILNFTPGGFFVGGGLTEGFYIGSATSFATTKIALKVNAGLLTDRLKITAYLITPFNSFFKEDMWVGASIGFRF